MHFKVLPYEFYPSTDNRIVIRQQRTLSKDDAQHIVLDRGQMKVFISHLQQFVDRLSVEAMCTEVSTLFEEPKR